MMHRASSLRQLSFLLFAVAESVETRTTAESDSVRLLDSQTDVGSRQYVCGTALLSY